LCLVQNFDLETAAIILGEDFSKGHINSFSADGLFLTVTSGSNRIYKISELTREVISQKNYSKIFNQESIHARLADFYLEKLLPSNSIEHLYKSKNHIKLQEVLKTSIREMAIIGRGDLVIQWADYITEITEHSDQMKKTIKIVGHLVNLEFDIAEAMAVEIDFLAQKDSNYEFLQQLSARILAHVYFSRGQFQRSLSKIDEALDFKNPIASIEVTDQIALLRIKASIHFLHDEHDRVVATFKRAKLLKPSEITVNVPYHLMCMTSMAMWSEGRIFEAAEHANIAITQANTFGFSSISAPFDAYLVLARCQSEMLQMEMASKTLTELKQLALNTRIWPWYFQASNNLLQLEIGRGLIHDSVDAIRDLQASLVSFNFSHELNWIVDSVEIYLRFAVNDLPRLKDLMNRAPRLDMVRRVEIACADLFDPKEKLLSVKLLPEKTVREKVEKYIYQTILHLDNETQALNTLGKALEIGAEVGFNDFLSAKRVCTPSWLRHQQRSQHFLEKV
jgi:tetratricopeptide (TPR) repeat protein